MSEAAENTVRVLVTGGYGFIGSHLVDLLVQQGYTVAVLDNLDPQVHPGLCRPDYAHPEEVVPFYYDQVQRISSHHACFADFKPHAIVHLAAKVGVGQAERAISEYVDANVFGTTRLIEAILAHNEHMKQPEDGIGRLIVAGSMSAYGEGMWSCPTHGTVRPVRLVEDLAVGRWEPRCPYHGCAEALSPEPIAEWASLRPGGVYAATKRDQEDYSLLVAGTTGLSTAVCRFFNVIGERQALSNPYTGVAAIFAARCLAGLRPRVYEDGEQTRDFVHVRDVARALASLLGSPRWAAAAQRWADPKAQGPFNVSTGVGSPVAAVAELACEILAPELSPEITGDYRTADIRACVGDSTRLFEATGWEPSVSAEEALRALFEGLKGLPAPAPAEELDRAHAELISQGLLVAPLPPGHETDAALREPTRWG